MAGPQKSQLLVKKAWEKTVQFSFRLATSYGWYASKANVIKDVS